MRTVCICASKKYKKEVKRFCLDLEKLGIVVFEPNINEPFPENSFLHSKLITKTIFKGFTLEHFDWIKKADACFSQYTPAKGGGLMSGIALKAIAPNHPFVKLISVVGNRPLVRLVHEYT
ncbi:MAG TPA: hypothetical protein VK254_02035, partial [Candidatus Bathyarchaeia archaeon]|nr:hypothetical protein [Candidatus Bathyarchaeia archaeon]